MQTTANSKRRSLRQTLWTLLRWAVTLGAITYVVSQITWQDRLVLPDGAVAFGWRVSTEDGAVFRTNAGESYPLPAEEPDEASAARVTPGFLSLLAGMDVGLFVLVLFAYPFSILLLAIRWRWLLRTHDLDPGLWEAVRLTWIGVLMNNIFPGATGGDLIKAVCISRRTEGKRVAAVMTVLIDRALGLLTFMLLGATAILLRGLLPGGGPELQGASKFVMLVLLGTAVAGIVVFSQRVRNLLRVDQILLRMPFGERLRTIDQSVFHFRHHLWVLGHCLVASVVIQAWTILCLFGLGLSLGLKVNLIYYFIFFPIIITVGAFAPSIAGLGVLEGLFQQFFSTVGATPASAVALCVLYRAMMLFSSLPGAWPTYREFASGAIPAAQEMEPITAQATPGVT